MWPSGMCAGAVGVVRGIGQSAGLAQPWLAAHGEHEPPQSVPVSLPFCSLSRHVAARQWPPEQWLLWQSAGESQTRPASHGAQDPPQSLSDSVPLRTVSVQLGGSQTVLHTKLTQSLPVAQRWLTAHAPQLPPQSTSVSVSFF